MNPGLVLVLAVGSLLAAGALIHRERMGWAFVMTCLTIAFFTATIFMALYPRVMVSSLGFSYQGWTYWVFRRRVSADTKLEY